MPSEETSEGQRFAPDDPREWLNRAKSSLAVAAARPEGVYLEDLCFAAQQAAEKALKAVILSTGRSIPRTHDIGALIADLAAADVECHELPDAAVTLTGYAVAARYPGVEEPIEEHEYEEALNLARSVVRWAEVAIARTGRL